ncbi:MAG TPA: phage holin family protein [Flavobacteriaceae bacterium]|nr:phage holin family protein [Flavobacteriaceae bacterium]
MIYDWIIDGVTTLALKNLLLWFALSTFVVFAAFIDLRLGVKKSKAEGNYTFSKGLERTLSKLNKRLTIMVIALIFDALNPVFYYTDFHPIPIVSIIFAVFLIRIEFISVLEHLEVGGRHKLRDQPKEILEILKEVKEIKNEVKDIIR